MLRRLQGARRARGFPSMQRVRWLQERMQTRADDGEDANHGERRASMQIDATVAMDATYAR
eukprot:2327022-Lingulodinium_polyedra.AAC.1